MSSGGEPVSVGADEVVVAELSAFEFANACRPHVQVLNCGGQGDVLGSPRWSQVGVVPDPGSGSEFMTPSKPRTAPIANKFSGGRCPLGTGTGQRSLTGSRMDPLTADLDSGTVGVSDGHVIDSSGALEHLVTPVACTLGASDGPSRLQRWQHLHQIAAPTAQLFNGELKVRFRAGREVLAELQNLVAEERVCCAFVSWVVDEERGQPVLRVTAAAGSPQDIEPIAAMFAATDRRSEADRHTVVP